MRRLPTSDRLGWLLDDANRRYPAEALLTHAYAWPLRPRTPLFWLARDLLLPVLWARAWSVRRYEWRGNAVDVRAPPRALAGLRLRFSRLR